MIRGFNTDRLKTTRWIWKASSSNIQLDRFYLHYKNCLFIYFPVKRVILTFANLKE